MVTNVRYRYSEARAQRLHSRARFTYVAATLLAAFSLMSLWGSDWTVTRVWMKAAGTAVVLAGVGLVLDWSAWRVGRGPRTKLVRAAQQTGPTDQTAAAPVPDQPVRGRVYGSPADRSTPVRLGWRRHRSGGICYRPCLRWLQPRPRRRRYSECPYWTRSLTDSDFALCS
jgi:hypothetical protein